MHEGLLIGLDVGTQSVRALLADTRGRTLACARRPTPTRWIDEHSAEYDPDALWATVVEVLREVAREVPPGAAVLGISCASIGESCVLVGVGGEPLAPAMAWFDHRSVPDGEEVAARIGRDRLFEITGYTPDPTLTLCKLLWHRRSDPNCFAHVKKVLPISPWISFKLCGVAAVDPSLAARTFCLDLRSGNWATDLLADLDFDPDIFPPIRPSGTPLGPVLPHVLRHIGLPGAPMVAVGAQDHISGAFAAGATKPGIFLDSLGTSEALLLTAAQPDMSSTSRALGFVQTSASLGERFYFVASGLNRSGGAIEWAFKTIAPGVSREKLLAEAAAEPPGSGGLIFVPNMAGSSAPNPQVDDAGAFVGVTDATRRGSMLRAVIEGVAMEAHLVSSALCSPPDAQRPEELRVIGGGTRNTLLLEIKASVSGQKLTVCDEPEMTAIGAALLGGVGAAVWNTFDEALAETRLPTHVVYPNPDWQKNYKELMGSVYCGLRNSLTHFNQKLALFRRQST